LLPEVVKAAAASLKRHDGWQLRHAPTMPEELVPAHFMLKEEVEETFSTPPGPSIVRLVCRKNHKTAVVRYTSNANPIGSLCQVYAGKPIRSGQLIIGKLGCADLIRSRLSDEVEFISGPRKAVTNELLAAYISPNSPEAEMSFLDRLNTGQAVLESHVKRVCDALFIDIADIVFAVPTVYQNRKLVNFDWANSIWAEPWSEWSNALTEGFDQFDVPSYNIYFKIMAEPETDQIYRQLGVALGPLYSCLAAWSGALTTALKRRLMSATEGLHKLGFDCWVSYRAGFRHGEPDCRPKLFLTVAEMGFVRETVIVRDYLRIYPNLDFDLLPKSLPYYR
jgi:hypothetical protein